MCNIQANLQYIIASNEPCAPGHILYQFCFSFVYLMIHMRKGNTASSSCCAATHRGLCNFMFAARVRAFRDRVHALSSGCIVVRRPLADTLATEDGPRPCHTRAHCTYTIIYAFAAASLGHSESRCCV